jgi:type I restriction enzyme R subunit
VVSAIKKAFADPYGENDDAAVKKITGSVDKIRKLIRSFRTDDSTISSQQRVARPIVCS